MLKKDEEKIEFFSVDPELTVPTRRLGYNIADKIGKVFFIFVFVCVVIYLCCGFFDVFLKKTPTSSIANSHGFRKSYTSRNCTVDVRGDLTCNGKPAVGYLVKLYDQETFTNSGGYFEISTTMVDVHQTANYEFSIFYDCPYGKPCERKVSIVIPESYVSCGNEAKKVF
uniref:Uncharacterized protein n=1 Tax=Panagrolaimus sp. ES5 TaxID=591445 RepID=A0AC34GII1_9BILA